MVTLLLLVFNKGCLTELSNPEKSPVIPEPENCTKALLVVPLLDILG